MALYSFFSPSLLYPPSHIPRRLFCPKASLSSSSPESKASQSVSSATSTTTSPTPSVESRPPDPAFNYALTNPNGNPIVRIVRATESSIERGCIYIIDAYKVYWSSCVKGVHTGQMVLRLVEAIDVYLAGTVMLIFGMGLYGLFISNVPPDVPPTVDRALKGSSLFGMFAMKERPKWMKICSLDELKTKVGHVIVMILLVKMFERSKMVTIVTGLDLLCYSICIFLSSASLYILHNLHKSD
ncbi:hypothetical protein GmHk_15G045313 [Glycine max]|uniref:uncharacterized protein isoform X2 n=1 Tax=Glycine max TaxID=3847 RepID=UPI00071918E8|nr:uncharacterized protein LOC100799451 isoform X2 [Glycine max]XP_028204692.1 uncharacterized protein LOC114388410 isoform X2 [Glycine soja]KAH1211170.1 hypothetical protein GmHk_15G045313 [Glycine max]|eukprot:XP_014623681.1 uncharacterized protein LOC100799451 isoform X2 [Glycine max]